jgi:hypothetical protein
MEDLPLVSLRQTVDTHIGSFLYHEKFPTQQFVNEGCLRTAL